MVRKFMFLSIHKKQIQLIDRNVNVKETFRAVYSKMGNEI